MKNRTTNAISAPDSLRWLLTCLVLLMAHASWAQLDPNTVPKPSAYYPLDVTIKNPDVGYARFKEVNAFDASGNGLHGTVYGEQSFEAVPFFGRTALQSGGLYRSVGIPDPYANTNIRKGMTLTFWLHYDPDVLPYSDAIYNPRFVVDYTSYGLVYATSRNTDPHVLPQSWYPFTDSGWYFISIVADSQQANLYYDYVPVLDSFKTAVTALQMDSTTIVASMAPNPSLFGSSLCGGTNAQMRDVRFFNTKLTSDQINFYRVKDIENAVGKFNAGSYLMQGAYAFYPMTGFTNNYGGACEECIYYNMPETIRNRNGIIEADFVSPMTADRFNRPNNALSLSGTEDAHVPNFFGNYDSRQGYTLSFWTKLETAVTSSDTGIAPPFTAQDARRKMFYAKDAQGRDLLGMQQTNDRIGTLRYAVKKDGSILPWYFWLYDPVSFKNKALGWYHVILVQDKKWMKVYLSAKDDTIKCDCAADDDACLTGCPAYYSYLGTCDLSQAVTWGFGDNSTPIKYLDDFRIYNWPMNEREVGGLHEVDAGRERWANYGAPNGGSARYRPVGTDGMPLMLFPNPNKGSFTLGFRLSVEEPVALKMVDVQGRVVYEATHAGVAGYQELRLEVPGLSAGLYFLTVQTPAFNSTEKVTVEP